MSAGRGGQGGRGAVGDRGGGVWGCDTTILFFNLKEAGYE